MSLHDALADFTTALADLDMAESEVQALPGSEIRDRHLLRIGQAKAQVAVVQSAAVQLTSAFTGLKRGVRFKLPQHAENIALYALRGGTAALAAVTYSARQFVHNQQNPDAPPVILGMLAGANWAGLGAMIGSLEGMRK